MGKTFMRSKRWAVAAAIFLASSGVALAAFNDYLQHLQKVESNGNPKATNPYGTASGLYGLTQAAMVDAKWISQNSKPSSSNFGNGDWSNVTFQPNPYGITTKEQFLANPQAQADAAKAFAQSNWNYMNKQGVTSKVGEDFKGVKLNEAAMVECAHFLGAPGCSSYLKTGKLPSYVTSAPGQTEELVLKRMADASQYDVSDVTGSNTVVDNAVSNPGGNATPGVYCNVQIAQMQVDAGNQAVANHVAIATNPQTGFTTFNGGAIADLTGTPSANGGGSMSPLPAGSSTFSGLSCIERMLQGGMDIFFSPPNLGGLLNMLTQQVCNQANQMFAQLTQPITSQLTQTASLGGYFPGMNIGSLGGGLNVNTHMGGGGSTGINSNVGALLSGDMSAWRNGGNYNQMRPMTMESTGAYAGGLFGN